MENIEYDILAQNERMDRNLLDELEELMVDTVCYRREMIRIAGDNYPVEVVKSQYLKLNSSHIEYVLAALYNALATIDRYYATLMNCDMYGSGARR